MDFILDASGAAAAKEASKVSGRITETGKYIGTFVSAESVTSKGGTKGVEFAFKSNTGETADYLSVWVEKEDGERLSGFKLISALLVCLRTRGAREAEIAVEKWDAEIEKRVQRRAMGYPDMMNKPIGVVLQKELYDKNDKKTGQIVTGEKMVLVAVFDAETEFTAAEVLDKARQPEQLANLVAYYSARPVRDGRKRGGSRPAAAQQDSYGGHAPAGGGGFSGMDDEIPF